MNDSSSLFLNRKLCDQREMVGWVCRGWQNYKREVRFVRFRFHQKWEMSLIVNKQPISMI